MRQAVIFAFAATIFFCPELIAEQVKDKAEKVAPDVTRPLYSLSYYIGTYEFDVQTADISYLDDLSDQGTDNIKSTKVPLDSIDVKLRDDGKVYTSVILVGAVDYFGTRYAKATILVPVTEDVDAWNVQLAKWKQERDEYLHRFKPHRLLPPKK